MAVAQHRSAESQHDSIMLFLGQTTGLRRTLMAATVALMGNACVSRQPWNKVSLRIVDQPVVLRRTAEGSGFNVSAFLVNHSSKPIVRGGACAPDLQRELGGSWQTVWSPICIGSGGLQWLGPGDSVLIKTSVFGYSIRREPRLDQRMTTGRYRIRIGVGLPPNSHDSRPKLRVYPSIPFTVRDSSGD